MKQHFYFLLELAKSDEYARKQLNKAMLEELKPDPILPSRLIGVVMPKEKKEPAAQKSRQEKWQEKVAAQDAHHAELRAKYEAQGYRGFELYTLVGNELKKEKKERGRERH
jgi:hypothetical protein